MIRVLIVSDVRIVREALSSMLARQLDVVGSTGIEHAGAHSCELKPDIVLLDVARPDNVTHVRELARAAPGCKVVAFGVRETDEEILALAAAGTAGYVRDSASSGDVAEVLQRVMQGELLCSPQAAASLFHQVAVLSRRGPGPECARVLSPRELQIACLIDRGLTNKQIARELGIEVATVKNHVHHLCEKLQVHRRGEAAARIRTDLRPSVGPSATPPWVEGAESAN